MPGLGLRLLPGHGSVLLFNSTKLAHGSCSTTNAGGLVRCGSALFTSSKVLKGLVAANTVALSYALKDEECRWKDTDVMMHDLLGSGDGAAAKKVRSKLKKARKCTRNEECYKIAKHIDGYDILGSW